MLPIMADCEVIHQFSKQKSKLNFSQKSDGEFIIFLLDTTLSMLSMGKLVLHFFAKLYWTSRLTYIIGCVAKINFKLKYFS